MKRCPQCGTIYTDETQFCLNDGAVLIEDHAAFQTENALDEEDTIIRHYPITVDISDAAAPSEQISYPISLAPNQPTIIIEKQRNAGKYLLFLIAGLLLGGGLVLATLLVARSLNQNDGATGNQTNNKNKAEKTVVSSQNLNSQTNALENINAPANVNVTQNNNANALEANKSHEEKTAAADDEFNGRVITLNAYLRTAPTKQSSEISILPKGDRLKIGTRENPGSPWYRVTCEHGASGWMHGDTIEFTK